MQDYSLEEFRLFCIHTYGINSSSSTTALEVMERNKQKNTRQRRTRCFIFYPKSVVVHGKTRATHSFVTQETLAALKRTEPCTTQPLIVGYNHVPPNQL